MKNGNAGKSIMALRKYHPLLLMMVPGFLYLLLNNYLPMMGIVIAFKNVDFAKGILGSDWSGFDNFRYLFQTSDAWMITRNTLLYNSAFILINLIVSVGLALLLNEVKQRMMSRFYQSVVLLPYLISMVIVGYLAFSMFSMETGLLNKTILPWLGLDEVFWYNETKYWPAILILVNTWKSAGYLCVIYLAAIIGIDKEYYEAATIDGAGKWQQIRSITLPQIAPVIIIMTLLQIGRIFYSDFGLFFQVPMDSGALLPVTNVIDTYVYRGLINMGDIGMSSAAGFYQSIVGFLLVFVSNFAVRKLSKENALF
ncbi:ABC transporter permease [Paenibacillaceae bacterium WGS1546]|uniref:ABC transporter permease n=1 Tax=Cohnella sp. WGS1546 TaxID=3366810 RepID=UPI00372CEF18